MKQYQKIKTVYFRDPKSNCKTLLEEIWAKPEFESLKDIDWMCTEKIDGTNIRIMWDGENVRFGGKTDSAQIPTILITALQDAFPNEKMKACFPNCDNICLYGEGYGKKIQKGGNYLPNRADFILFDVKIGDWWLNRAANEYIASKLQIAIVPIIGVLKLEEAIEFVNKGLIMKPVTELFNRKDERVISKIKYKHFVR